ncbi:MAG: glycogen/starch synthase [Clostridia bacterium]|nr:glycogen/starch synthase [Clostridia bacterium]
MRESKQAGTKRTTNNTTKSPIEILVEERESRKPKTAKKEEVSMTPKTKILFVASEARPFIATGGLADVIGSLPQALAKDPKYDIRVVLPLYADIKPDQRRKLSYLGNIFTPVSWRNQYCGIFTCEENGVTFYFIDNEYYFKRPGCYGYYDDGERFAFFSRSVL